MLESGLLQEHEDRYELVGAIPPLAIPATLHDSLMARLDQLASGLKVAQIGSAIGRQFSHELLTAVASMPDAELDAALDELVDAQLILCDGTPPRATYSFKHALVQDAAYGSLLLAQRQALHARIAEVLETRFPETLEASPELIAHHWTEAHLAPKALQLLAAGRPARERAVGECGGDLTPDQGAGSRRRASRERRASTPGDRPPPRAGPGAHQHEGAPDAARWRRPMPGLWSSVRLSPIRPSTSPRCGMRGVSPSASRRGSR